MTKKKKLYEINESIKEDKKFLNTSFEEIDFDKIKKYYLN